MTVVEHIYFTKEELKYIIECVETQEEGLTPSKLGTKLKEKCQKKLDNWEVC